MKRSLIWLVAWVVAVVPVSVGFAQTGVAGDWAVTVFSDRGLFPMGLTLALEGEALSGTLTSDEMGSSELEGTFQDDMLEFKADMSVEGQMSTLTFSGDFDGDGTITGSFEGGSFGTAGFTAERK